MKKQQTEEQIKALLDKAAQKPMSEDPMAMIGFTATLLAAQMTTLQIQADMEEKTAQQEEATN